MSDAIWFSLSSAQVRCMRSSSSAGKELGIVTLTPSSGFEAGCSLLFHYCTGFLLNKSVLLNFPMIPYERGENEVM